MTLTFRTFLYVLDYIETLVVQVSSTCLFIRITSFTDNLGNISLTTYLHDKPTNTSYTIFICGHERRNEICEYLTIDLEGKFYFLYRYKSNLQFITQCLANKTTGVSVEMKLNRS